MMRENEIRKTNNDIQEADGTVENGKAIIKKERKRMNPIVKWTLIGGGAALVIGGVVFCVVKGHKVPAQTVGKIADVAVEAATTAV